MLNHSVFFAREPILHGGNSYLCLDSRVGLKNILPVLETDDGSRIFLPAPAVTYIAHQVPKLKGK